MSMSPEAADAALTVASKPSSTAAHRERHARARDFCCGDEFLLPLPDDAFMGWFS
jgi:hypothetical protein